MTKKEFSVKMTNKNKEDLIRLANRYNLSISETCEQIISIYLEQLKKEEINNA